KPARAAFEDVDGQLEQAARTLGVSELALFFRVTLPLAWRGILAGLLLVLALALGLGALLLGRQSANRPVAAIPAPSSSAAEQAVPT
ncbi:MAG: ABC transporter permease subunit, partial [Stenotrophomonas sp.]